jgi:hypothetical protein
MTAGRTIATADKSTHAARAAQFALVAAAVLTIVGLGLGFFWAHAPNLAQQAIIGVLLWPLLILNPSTVTGASIACFMLQVPLLWLVAFAFLRYRVRGRQNAL